MASEVYSVLIGGKAGEGVKKAAHLIAHIAMACGKHVFQEDDYQSLIKGGHNFSIVSISDEILYNSYKYPDLIISFDDRSIRTHSAKLKPGGLHFCNGDDAASAEATALRLPLSSLMKSVYGEEGNVSLAAVSVFCAQWGIPVETLGRLIDREYRRNQAENRSFAEQVYQLTKEILPHTPATHQMSTSPAKLYSGNQLIASGAWTAGLDLYFSYPMTPASSILHYLALKRDSHKVYAIHVESELAAANMAIGALFAGKKAAVGSSGGGFALMQEAFSLAGMVEAPLLCFLSSRPGPATGVSTYTAQEDLFFALNQGHGEFPRIVASPDSFERAFTLSAELLDLAWEAQTPAILLTEKHLSESAADIVLSDVDFPQEAPLPISDESDYKRYAITDSGISPLKFPGHAHSGDDDVIKWNSHEHGENGVRIDNAPAMIAMKDKRNRKAASIRQATRRYKRVAHYGKGDTLVFAYGSTALELREALKYHSFKLIVPIYLEPFPSEELAEYRGKEAIIVEHSSHPHFAEFLRIKLDIRSKADILRYDGRTWDSMELAKLIREAENA